MRKIKIKLLIGSKAEQYEELKERDTARPPKSAPPGIPGKVGMVCPACGNKALPWDRFCPECGQRWFA